MTGVPCLGDPDHKGAAASEGRTRGNEIQKEKARRGKKGNGRRRAGATLSCPVSTRFFLIFMQMSKHFLSLSGDGMAVGLV